MAKSGFHILCEAIVFKLTAVAWSTIYKRWYITTVTEALSSLINIDKIIGLLTVVLMTILSVIIVTINVVLTDLLTTVLVKVLSPPLVAATASVFVIRQLH